MVDLTMDRDDPNYCTWCGVAHTPRIGGPSLGRPDDGGGIGALRL